MRQIAVFSGSAIFTLILVLTSCGSTREYQGAGQVEDRAQVQKEWGLTEKERQIFEGEYAEEAESIADSTEYEIIVIDPGFNTWLRAMAPPRGYHTQQYMESRNQVWVTEWNIRNRQTQVYDPFLYENYIDYEFGVDYGYEVNYILYNYLVYFQRKNGVRLGSFEPRLN